ncbi:MAG TPA: DUF4160 domain-containing protein [Gammaproteobacteria bacterium]|nr:DUF4160 domain-containing protein [Gammaproteobacteria bacterium]
MSPTVFKEKGFRFFFFSKEESRMHIHVSSPKGEAKFWLEPIVALARHFNLSQKELKEIQTIVEERADEIKRAWKKHFRN